MGQTVRKVIVALVALGLAAWLGWLVAARVMALRDQTAGDPRESFVAPVEVAEVTRGPIELRRQFSGTLEATASFVVSPKVSGRIERLTVDLADRVKRGQVVARLDDDEFVQSVAQARAELAVAEANLTEARSSLEIARRESERVQTLRERGVASESQYDATRAEQLAAEAAVAVATAQVTRAESAVRSAEIRLGYTTVAATWSGDDDERVVADRHVDEGDTVAANTPLLTIVDLDPIVAVVYVTERDYGLLAPGQSVALRTDAYPDRTFEGQIVRIAPVFERGSRQARVEMTVPNTEQRLKPGMFVRAEAVLDRRENATIVPVEALTRRDDRHVVFVVSEDGRSVSMRRVQVGIQQDDHVQIIGEGVSGRVVTLGQQLVSDGSPIVIPDQARGSAEGGAAE